MSFSFLDKRCHCHEAGLCGKPRGKCYHFIGNNRCPFDCEQALLGYIAIFDDGPDLVADLITADHFLWRCHRRLFEIFRDLIRAGKDRMPETVAPLFEQRGGMPLENYMRTLLLSAPLIVRGYAEMMRDAAIARGAAAPASELMTEAA